MDSPVEFYPNIVRRKSYRIGPNGKFLGYGNYRASIVEDCKSRCVYCDVTLDEMGEEGMVLDHFRPKANFPSLKDNPWNLVLACPVCNRLKSDIWHVPISKGSIKANVIGFADPFRSDRSTYFSVEDDGWLEPTGSTASFMARLLALNRPSRVKIRYKRMLERNKNTFIKAATNAMRSAIDLRKKGEIDEAVLIGTFENLTDLLALINGETSVGSR